MSRKLTDSNNINVNLVRLNRKRKIDDQNKQKIIEIIDLTKDDEEIKQNICSNLIIVIQFNLLFLFLLNKSKLILNYNFYICFFK
jgi:hypothetical protein